MNSTNNSTGKDILKVMGIMIIISVVTVAGICIALYAATEINSSSSYNNDIEKLKAEAQADYHRKLAEYTKEKEQNKVQIPVVNVDMNGNGMNVQAPGVNVDMNGNGMTVQAPGVNVDMNGNGMTVQVGGLTVRL